MAKHYEAIEQVALSKLFPVGDFRLIREEDREFPGGLSEIPIKIDVKRKFAKQLSFRVPWDGEIYAFVKCKNTLFEKTGYDNTIKITVSDWDEHFVIIFEDNKGHEEPVYSVAKKELQELLEECLRPDKLD